MQCWDRAGPERVQLTQTGDDWRCARYRQCGVNSPPYAVEKFAQSLEQVQRAGLVCTKTCVRFEVKRGVGLRLICFTDESTLHVWRI